MANNSRLFLVTFDISDNKRRRTLTKYLKAKGVRVQRSVFECWGDQKTENEFKNFFDRFYETGDNIRMYTLKSEKNIITYGDGLEEQPEGFYIC